jgi:hypothetical protein
MQAADACWQRSTRRGLRIVTPEPGEAPAPSSLCRCNRQLLRRALVSPTEDALRFGPPGSMVDIANSTEPTVNGA